MGLPFDLFAELVRPYLNRRKKARIRQRFSLSVATFRLLPFSAFRPRRTDSKPGVTGPSLRCLVAQRSGAYNATPANGTTRRVPCHRQRTAGKSGPKETQQWPLPTEDSTLTPGEYGECDGGTPYGRCRRGISSNASMEHRWSSGHML